MQIGGRYNWKDQSERLVYMGRNWSSSGYWHQFSKVDEPGAVWCEVQDDQLSSFEATPPVERCKCGYPMPCAKRVPITLCRA